VASATIVITYTIGVANGKEAEVTDATVGGTSVITAGSDLGKQQAWFLSKDLMRLMVAKGRFPARVNGQITS